MDSKNLLKVLAAGALALSALTGCSQGSTGGGDTKKIGLHFELTGEVADYGSAEKKGAQLAIKLANEKSGSTVYEGIEFDNKSDTTEAVSIANQVVAAGVIGVVGPATSGASKATYQVNNDAKLPVISPSATEINVTHVDTKDANSAVYDYAYRTCFEDSFQGAAMAQFAYDTLNAKTAAIYGEVSDYGKGLTKAFTEQFTKLGGTVVATESYQSKTTDFNSVLTSLASKNFDVLYIPGYYQEAGLIIKQAKNLGIDAKIIGPDGFDSETLVSLAEAKNLNDVYYTTAYTTVGASAELQAFIDAYKKEYNEEPNMFAALAFDATNLLIQAVESANSTDGAAIKAELDKIEFSGITGSFTFDENHTPIKSVLVVELVDGVQSDAVNVTPKN